MLFYCFPLSLPLVIYTPSNPYQSSYLRLHTSPLHPCSSILFFFPHSLSLSIIIIDINYQSLLFTHSSLLSFYASLFYKPFIYKYRAVFLSYLLFIILCYSPQLGTILAGNIQDRIDL